MWEIKRGKLQLSKALLVATPLPVFSTRLPSMHRAKRNGGAFWQRALPQLSLRTFHRSLRHQLPVPGAKLAGKQPRGFASGACSDRLGSVSPAVRQSSLGEKERATKSNRPVCQGHSSIDGPSPQRDRPRQAERRFKCQPSFLAEFSVVLPRAGKRLLASSLPTASTRRRCFGNCRFLTCPALLH